MHDDFGGVYVAHAATTGLGPGNEWVLWCHASVADCSLVPVEVLRERIHAAVEPTCEAQEAWLRSVMGTDDVAVVGRRPNVVDRGRPFHGVPSEMFPRDNGMRLLPQFSADTVVFYAYGSRYAEALVPNPVASAASVVSLVGSLPYYMKFEQAVARFVGPGLWYPTQGLWQPVLQTALLAYLLAAVEVEQGD